MNANFDEQMIQLSLSLGRSASRLGEVAIGAVITKEEKIIATGINLRETTKTIATHAEFFAAKKANHWIKDWRLQDCTLYCFLEPCAMCTAMLVQARIKRIVFGCYDELGGGCGGAINLHLPAHGHKPKVSSGILAKESREQIQQFFKKQRLPS